MDPRPSFRSVGPVRTVDALIALGLFALGVIYLNPVATAAAEATHAFRDRDFLGLVLLAVQTLPLMWRHTAPRAVATTVLAAWIADRGFGYEASLATLGLVVAIHGVAAYAPKAAAYWWGGIACGTAILWTGFGAVVTDQVGPTEFFTMFLWVGIPFAIGRGDAYARERMTALEVGQQAAERAKVEGAEAAVRTERARIARELHDVVAHEITVMTLQAEGARRRVGASDRELTDALRTIGDSGRKGLAEMHRMIGALRDTSESDGDAMPTEVGTAHAAGSVDHLSPMPSLAALPTLAAQVEDAGLPVDLRVRGAAHVPAGVELSAYRIVQESLTNAMKHAGPGAHATVTVDRARTAVTITVEDDGRGVVSDAARLGGGHGLTGMRERVLTLGGAIEFGPRPGGGFRVRAVLPSQDDTVVPAVRSRKPAIAEAIAAAAQAPRDAKRTARADTRGARRR